MENEDKIPLDDYDGYCSFIDDMFSSWSPPDPIHQKFNDEKSLIQTFNYVLVKNGVDINVTLGDALSITLYDVAEIFRELGSVQQDKIFDEIKNIIPDDKKDLYKVELCNIFLNTIYTLKTTREFSKMFKNNYSLSQIKDKLLDNNNLPKVKAFSKEKIKTRSAFLKDLTMSILHLKCDVHPGKETRSSYEDVAKKHIAFWVENSEKDAYKAYRIFFDIKEKYSGSLTNRVMKNIFLDFFAPVFFNTKSERSSETIDNMFETEVSETYFSFCINI